MVRKRPTTRLDVIGKLKLTGIHAHAEYIESKQNNKYFIKPPNYDSAGDTLDSIYVRNHLENARMKELLQLLIKSQHREAHRNAKRMKFAEKNFTKLRQRLKEVDVFLKDCQDKRSSAERTIALEEKYQAKLSKRINKLMHDNKVLAEFRETFKETIAQYEPYERVLEDVVKQTKTFDSIEDCIQRCDAVMMVQVEAMRLNVERLEEIEVMKTRMVQLTREAAQNILGLKNLLDKHSRMFNHVRAAVAQWEIALVDSKREIYEREIIKEVTIDAIEQIYTMLCKRQGIQPTFHRRDTEKQLDYIRDEVIIIREVLEECTKLLPDNSERQKDEPTDKITHGC